jgi:hypothetical protein
LKVCKKKYLNYIKNSEVSTFSFRFSNNSYPSPFSLCFALFGLNLLNEINYSKQERIIISKSILKNINDFRDHLVLNKIDYFTDKAYLQLLTFSLSSLCILNTLENFPLEDHCLPLLCSDITSLLDSKKVSEGSPKSGNFAMFTAILLLHASNYLNEDCSSGIDEWVDYHLRNMNKFGFWGNESSMSHLQFQNGYHQYEIFNYLGIDNPKSEMAALAVASLADNAGRFAPYPGGGGCYDYDAVSIITTGGFKVLEEQKKLLIKTSNSILDDQNNDGGFCESKFIRPRSIQNFILALSHVKTKHSKARIERIRQLLTLQRPKHDRVNGAEHWTDGKYQREWAESNLWDSYFRMSTLARIDIALNPKSISDWNFINFPGIGFHETLKK